jgi:hypothetical protein
MKTFLSILVLSISISLISCGPTAVVVKPAPVVKVRPLAPSATHVWVDGNWVWRGGRYVWIDGYWARPKNRYHGYVPGHWKQTRRGYVWVNGYWR